VVNRMYSFLITLAVVTSILYATESRIESMGKRDIFFRDDMQVFKNPATIGIFGNFVMGTMGFVNDAIDTSIVPERSFDSAMVFVDSDNDSVSVSVPYTVYDTVYGKRTDVPTNQWFGVVYNYQLSKTLGVFGGAAFNRDNELDLFYDSLRTVIQTECLTKLALPEKTAFPEVRGKMDLMLGAALQGLNVGIGFSKASQDLKFIYDSTEYGSDVSLTSLSLGMETQAGTHSIEAYARLSMISYSNSTPDSAIDMPATTDNSLEIGARGFIKTNLKGGIVFVPALTIAKNALFNRTYSRYSGGVGMNLRLDGGLFWAGLEGEYFINTKDSTSYDSAANVERSGYGAHFNFGIEKSLIWKWLIVRVGGSKYIGIRTTKSAGNSLREWVENTADDGSSDDVLGFGIGLNYQSRLRFDITLNEALPYFNPFSNGLQNSTNGAHMVLRISSTFSL